MMWSPPTQSIFRPWFRMSKELSWDPQPLAKNFPFNHSRNRNSRTLELTKELCLVGMRREALHLQECWTRTLMPGGKSTSKETEEERGLWDTHCDTGVQSGRVKDLLTQSLPLYPMVGLFWVSKPAGAWDQGFARALVCRRKPHSSR